MATVAQSGAFIAAGMCYSFSMTKLDDIKNAVRQLSPEEVRVLHDWLEDLHADLWDEQIERDAKAGKLDALAAEAIGEHEAGKSQRLR